ncbi:hypothetical protein PMIN01_13541 [Paraphaeosphaeria minitans]|uniref:BZIP domain-containing protein n=1 Tax=Paraphaeosphaeria minitans TaxID=565426 RepID=A0A9P6KIL2_9PLEO|nr:hypothetical protein PMIN01_13541 [Paraphaeosphaeria minitans]
MGRKKYMTEEEREEARRLQNKLAQRAYRERKKCQGNTTPSIGTDKRRAKKRAKRRIVEQASKDVGRPESESRLPERPSARPMLEKGNVESIARISQSTIDPSVRTNSGMLEQASTYVGCLESEWNVPSDPSARLMLEMQLTRTMEDLESVARTLQSTTDSLAREYMREQRPCIQRMIDKLQTLQEDRSESAEADSTHRLPVQLNAVPDCQPCSESPLKVSKPSSGDMIRSLRAQVRQLKLLGSIEWGYTVENRTVLTSRIT